VVWVGERTVPVSGLAETLNSAAAPEHGPAVILAGLTRQHAFRIGELLGQRDVVIKGLSGLLPRLSSYTGVSAEADGSVLLVLDSSGLIEQARRRQRTPGGPPPAGSESTSTLDSAPPGRQASTILVVDDALTVRELQRAILERAGYTVLTAADGVAALAIAESTPVDLVLTDVQMPRMDGLELTRTLRAHPKLSGIGIVVLTSLGTDEDRRRGLDAGADGYIAKNQFDEQKLIDSVQRILGEPA
jgi:two-component system chemotaxis sensor kinase CheA